jgi:hypothetical protein
MAFESTRAYRAEPAVIPASAAIPANAGIQFLHGAHGFPRSRE